jgi:hypothetical protein
MAAEEDSVPHDVEMEERGNDCEDADYECGPVRRGRADESVNEPIERLGQARNAENHDQISEQAAAEAESLLLHACIRARCEGDVVNLNQNDGKVLAKPAMGHGHGVDH